MPHVIRTSSYDWLGGIAPLIIAVPAFVLGQHLLIGTFCLLLAVALSTRYRGIELDVPNRRYRHFQWLIGMRLGSWTRLPATARVVLKPHSCFVQTPNPMPDATAPISLRDDHLTLLLSVPGSVIGEVIQEYALSERREAIALGQELADALKVPLLVMEGV